MTPVADIPAMSIDFAIDRGGTFTDVWASVPGQPDIVNKLLSVDPGNYQDAPSEGIRRVLEKVTGTQIPRSSLLPKKLIRSIRMGTTVATNALLTRNGTRHGMLVTEGFRDFLDIGYQSRPKLFELGIKKPELLYEEVIEVSERVTVEGFDEDIDKDARPPPVEEPGVLVKGLTADFIRILKPLNDDEVRAKLLGIKEKGIDAVAICFAHSYLYPTHEERAAEIAAELGFRHVSISCRAGSHMIRMVSRGSSASADAYLTPEIQRYVDGFAKGFEGGNLDNVSCEFMQSDGGLVSHKAFTGLKATLSGPAGGVVGYARTSYDGKTPVVGFDMGGTSTDVSRFGGSLEHVFETTTAGVTIRGPQLDINTVAAGGGSMLFWSNGLLKVGPDSAGAHPGPAAYRKGGPLTVTDANLLLGRIIPEYFPSIFGENEKQPLDSEIVAKKFADLVKVINKETGQNLDVCQLASGFIDVANESMCRAIRTLTEARGFETGQHNLAVFGGAGGQHACEVADKLGISRVIIHKYSSILSAYGMALAEVVSESQEPNSEVLTAESLVNINKRVENLKQNTLNSLLSQGVNQKSIEFFVYLNLRYQGTDTTFMIPAPEDGNYRRSFEQEHYRELSFTFPESRKVLVDDIRVRGVGKSEHSNQDNETLSRELASTPFFTVKETEAAHKSSVYFASLGMQEAPVFLLDKLASGSTVPGPAVIIDSTQTIVIVPNATARVLSSHVVIDLSDHIRMSAPEEPLTVDPIKLSVFGHRFMSVAEQMGRTLQKTSLSLNIKERLDFSCAIFTPDGQLVANAPHVPVHLGSMSYAVRFQNELYKGELKPGDVLLSNHPESGGTHLPDITVMTPVFEKNSGEICFWTASRGHHMDIGGYAGTSMPANSTELWQEGAAIKSFFLVRDGKFDEEGICKLLTDPGKYPGCTPSRRLGDNLSDLKAQVAANNKGRVLIDALMEEYGKKTVHFYMSSIQDNAEIAVRNFLKKTRQLSGGKTLRAEDKLDNGSTMKVAINIDETGGAVIDFTGTSVEMLSNMNAPPAITYSALIYTLRLLIGEDIPMNQGCLGPCEIIIPKGSFLNPSSGAAVCCGNTLTSQRLTDLILKAFEAAAGSQGCMNCFGFFGRSGVDEDGKPLEGFGYNYGETICGGEGAGPTWHGASGVHTHMTNTKTTDVELMEKRYPILIREFSIRQGSGGKGRFNGGCGIVRDFECRLPLTFSMISERRVNRPFGMFGGEDAECGKNFWVKKNPNPEDASWTERWVDLGPRGQVDLDTGDRFVVHTPGGGGWGVPEKVNGVNGEVNGENHADTTTFYPRATGTYHIYSEAQAQSS